MWWIVLDVLAVAIILFFVYRSYRRGFARTVLELAAFFVAYFLASTCSGIVADWTYDTFVDQKLLTGIETTLNETTDAVLTEVLPEYVVSRARSLGIYDSIVDSQRETAADTAKALSETVARPVVTNMIRMVASVLLFSILMFVLRFVVRAVDKVFRLPLIGSINRILGGVVGLVKGGIVVLLFCFLVSVLMILNDGEFWIFTHQNIEKTYLFRYIYNINPFLG